MSKVNPEEVVAMIKSVVMSSKGDMTLNNLRKDYELITGGKIPFRNLGFRNLEEFIQSDVCSHALSLFQDTEGYMYCRAVSDSSTSHIQKLVAGQNQKVGRRKHLTKVPALARKPLLPTPTWRRPPTFQTRHSPQVNSYGASSYSNGPVRQSSPEFKQPQVVQSSRAITGSSSLYTKPSVSPPPPRSQPQPQQQPPPQPPPRNIPEPTPIPRVPPVAVPPPVPLDVQQVRRRHSPVRAPVSNHYQEATTPLNGTSDTASASIRPKIKKNLTQKDKLDKHCKALGLPEPVYNTFPMQKGVASFLCKVTVEKKSYSTYPEQFPTPREAEEESAKIAFASLQNLEERPVLRVSDNEYTVICRIRDIIAGKTNGIISKSIPGDYKKNYNEELPKNWLDLVKMHTAYFKVDEIDASRAIIVPIKSESLMTRSLSEVSDDCKSTDSGCSTHTPDIVLPDYSDTWDVYISHATSAVDVYIRIIGENYSEKYEEMANDMDLHYSYNQGVAPAQVKSGSLYAAKYDETWHRVEVISVDNDTKEVECYFVDNGDTDPVPISCVQVLEMQFCTLPYQAVHCKLAGLEEHAKNNNVRCLLMDLIVGKTCVAKVVDQDDLSLVLYDTATESDVELNRHILEKAVDSHEISQLESLGEVYVSHFGSDGEFWVQRESPGFSLLMSLVDELPPKGEEEPEIEEVSYDKLYLALYSEDAVWYRAKVVGTVEDGKVKVFFVDFGNDDVVALSNLRELTVCPKLINIPKQGIHCKLHDVPSSRDMEWTEAAITKFKELAPDDVPLILKTVSTSSDGVSEVQLFKRTGPNGELVSINITLSLENSLFKKRPITSATDKVTNSPVRRGSKISPKKTATDVNKAEKRKSSASLSFGNLKVPEVGSGVDVHITLAASPSTFSCQLCSGGEMFDNMVLNMNCYYNKRENCTKVSEESILPGKPFACHHSDDVWYRAEISTVQNDSSEPMIYAYFVDYGDYALTSLARLQPMQAQFMELPKQAISASLAGVVPVNGDWTPEACYYFKGLVEERQFVALVKRKSVNAQSVETMHVQLVDTSNGYCDKFIHSVLVTAGQARLEDDS